MYEPVNPEPGATLPLPGSADKIRDMDRLRTRQFYIETVQARLFQDQMQFAGAPASVAAAFRATLDIIMERGFAALSMRAIATRAGVSPGTLTYHFSGKADLIAKCLDHFVTEEFGRLLSTAQQVDDPALTLEIGIRTQIEISLHPLARRFDFEYWAHAEQDPTARAHLERMQQQLRQNTAGLIRRIHPTRSQDQALRQAALIQTLIEGLAITLPPDPARATALGLDRFYEDTVQTCLRLASQPPND